MADTVGLCTRLEVFRTTGKVWVQPTGQTTSEVFLMWFFVGTRDVVTDDDVSAFDRVRHSMWVAMLQRAMDSGQLVTITHDDFGSFCFTVKVGST
jgi:hypothetical protein